MESEPKRHFSSAYNPTVEFTVNPPAHPSTNNPPAHPNNPRTLLARLLTTTEDFDEHRGHVRMKPGHARRLLRALDAQYLNQVRVDSDVLVVPLGTNIIKIQCTGSEIF